jgi:large subunit ribosomal protein L25
VSLDLPDGQAQDTTIIKEIQHHPLKGEMQHVDFHRISLTEKIIVEVAVEAEGNPVGVRTEGGILEHMLYEVEVECLPTDIPDKVVFDVTEMSIGDTIHVSDLVVEGNVEIVTESDRSVFVVVPPTVAQVAEDEEEEEALEEEEMQEPEVIERGKRDEEEEEEE